MKRQSMMIMSGICLIFAYASVLAGNYTVGYLCGLLSLLLVLYICFVHGVFHVHIGWLVLQFPFLYCGYQLFTLPYEVSYILGMLNVITVGYGLLLQGMIRELSYKEMKELRMWLLALSCVVWVCWSLVLFVLAMCFDSLLVGNEWISLVYAMEMECCCMFVLCGVFLVSSLYCWFLENERIPNCKEL